MEIIKTYIIPILATLSSILTFYIDKNNKKKTFVYFVILVLILLSVFTIISGIFENKSENKTKESIETIKINTQMILKLVDSYGYSKENKKNISIDKLNVSEKADENIFQFESTLKTNENQHITIQYFPKDFDGDRINKILASKEFKIQILSPKNNLETNSIWYGNDVNINQVKYISLLLVRAGVNIKNIKKFSRKGVIQIGSDPNYANKSNTKIEEIIKL